MTKHTPGPWRFEPQTNTIRNEPNNYWLASMDSWDGAVNNEANARLIAAAPDLLAALTRAIQHYEALGVTQPWFPQAKAAIAKTEGSAS